MQFSLNFKKVLPQILHDAEAAGFPRLLAKTLHDAAPDGTRSISLELNRAGKNLYNGSVNFCDIKGVGRTVVLGNIIALEPPLLALTELALGLLCPEDKGTPQ